MSRPPPDRGRELLRLPRFGGGHLALERHDYQGHPWYRLVSKKDEQAEERFAVVKARELRQLASELSAEADRLEVFSRAEGREGGEGRGRPSRARTGCAVPDDVASPSPPERPPARHPSQHRTENARAFLARTSKPEGRRG